MAKGDARPRRDTASKRRPRPCSTSPTGSSGPASWWSSFRSSPRCATYLILTGLTPIAPRDEVVRRGPLRQRGPDHRHDRGDRLAGLGHVAGLARQARGRAPACAHRAAVLHHRRASGDAARRRRYDDVLALARRLVLDAHARHHLKLARRGEGLRRRARAGDPDRRGQHGPRHRRGSRHRRRSARPSSAIWSSRRRVCAICPVAYIIDDKGAPVARRARGREAALHQAVGGERSARRRRTRFRC